MSRAQGTLTSSLRLTLADDTVAAMAMGPLLPAQVTAELGRAVQAMTERLGGPSALSMVAAEGWKPFAGACGLLAGAGSTPVAVGPISTALDYVGPGAQAEPTDRIGFVAPAALRRRWWQRAGTDFLDPTMELWRSGWSPLAVERIDIAAADPSVAAIEVVVGHARPTPPPKPVKPVKSPNSRDL